MDRYVSRAIKSDLWLQVRIEVGLPEVQTVTPKQVLEEFSRSVGLKPGPPERDIALLQARLPGPLPHEIRELLGYSAGFDIDLGQLLTSRNRMVGPASIVFAGSGGLGLRNVLPFPVVLLGDGLGNFWAVDVSPDGAWGAVVLVCHDPPVVAIQAAELASFLGQVLDFRRRDPKDTLDYVRNEGTTRIWRDDPWLIAVEDARRAQDAVVSSFASRLPDDFHVADLRSGETGRGFSWGKAGPDADIRRSGADLLFGVEPKGPGFFRRLLSR